MPYPAQIDPRRLGLDALQVVEELEKNDWSLREVAGRLGVSPNALYRYVDDRAGLAILMGEAAARALMASGFRGVAGTGDEAVVRMSLNFIRFATRRPHAYFAFMNAKPELDHPSMVAWFELWAKVNELVRSAVPDSGDAAAFSLWALLHGRIELFRGAAYRAPVDAGLEDAVRALLEGYRQGGPHPSPLPPHARLDP
ncbi:MAG: hypothetical protein AAGD10_03400 [Myxococcota bacterium]